MTPLNKLKRPSQVVRAVYSLYVGLEMGYLHHEILIDWKNKYLLVGGDF